MTDYFREPPQFGFNPTFTVLCNSDITKGDIIKICKNLGTYPYENKKGGLTYEDANRNITFELVETPTTPSSNWPIRDYYNVFGITDNNPSTIQEWTNNNDILLYDGTAFKVYLYSIKNAKRFHDDEINKIKDCFRHFKMYEI